MANDIHQSDSNNTANNKSKIKKDEKLPSQDEAFGILDHAKRELSIAGLDKKGSDYDGDLAKWVIQIIEVFSSQGHSGNSARDTIDVVRQLINWGPLSPFTTNPAEWQETTDILSEEQKSAGERLWQNQRSPSVFSTDAGKTWFRMDGERRDDGSLYVYKSLDHTEKEEGSSETTEKTADKAGTTKPTNTSKNPKANGRVQEKGKSSQPTKPVKGNGDKPRTTPDEQSPKA